MKNKMLDYIITILKVILFLGIITTILAIINIFKFNIIIHVIVLTSDVWIFSLLITIYSIIRHNDKVILNMYKK